MHRSRPPRPGEGGRGLPYFSSISIDPCFVPEPSRNRGRVSLGARLNHNGLPIFEGDPIMATATLQGIVRHLGLAVAVRTSAGVADAQLLERFVSRRDEAAFELLVWRHGKMVLG